MANPNTHSKKEAPDDKEKQFIINVNRLMIEATLAKDEEKIKNLIMHAMKLYLTEGNSYDRHALMMTGETPVSVMAQEGNEWWEFKDRKLSYVLETLESIYTSKTSEDQARKMVKRLIDYLV